MNNLIIEDYIAKHPQQLREDLNAELALASLQGLNEKEIIKRLRKYIEKQKIPFVPINGDGKIESLSPPKQLTIKKRKQLRRNIVICAAYKQGCSQRLLSEVFNLARSRIAMIIKKTLIVIISFFPFNVSSQEIDNNPGILNVTKYGILPNPEGNGTDNSKNFKKLYNSLTKPTTLYFPTGQYQWGETTFRNNDYMTMKGDGDRQTIIQITDSFPGFVDNVRSDFNFNEFGQPDSTNILDNTIGNSVGFATQGRSVAYLPAHALCLGRLKDSSWDYYSTVSELTFRMMIGPGTSGRIPENEAIAGIGDYYPTYAPGPFIIFTGMDAEGQGTIGISFRLKGDPSKLQRRVIVKYGDSTKIHRIIISIDLTKDEKIVLVDGKKAIIVNDILTYPNIPVPIVKGKIFEEQKLDWPFLLGTASSMINAGGVKIADIVFYGFWVGDKANPTDPTNDYIRYMDKDCIGFYNPTYKSEDRLLRFDARDSQGRAVVMDTLGTVRGLGGQKTTDLSIEKGSVCVLSGYSYNDVHERVRYTGNTTGFAHIRTGGGSYLTKINDAQFGGTHLGLSLFGSIAKVSNVQITRGGAYSISLCSTSADLDNIMITGFSTNPDGGYLIRAGAGYGNSIYGRSLLSDNEGFSAFNVAYFDMEQAPYTASSLYLEACEAAAIGKDGYFIKLIGYKKDETYKLIPIVVANNIRVPDGCAGIVYIDGPPNIWTGSVSSVSTVKAARGPGVGKVKVGSP